MSGIIGGAGSKSGVIGTTELDYEEGTWTPNWSTTGVNTTVAYHTQDGHYLKIGELVTCWATMATNATTWTGTYVQLGGLPFNTEYKTIRGFVTQSHDYAGDTPSLMSFAATTRMYCYYRDAADGQTHPLLESDMDHGANKNYIEFYVIYKVA